MVDDGERSLADVAVLRFERLAEVGIVVHVRAARTPAAERRSGVVNTVCRRSVPDAGGGEHSLLAAHAVGFPLAGGGLDHPPARHGVGVVDVAGGIEQAVADLGRNRGQQAAVGHDGLEQLGGRAHAFLEPLGPDRRGDALAHRSLNWASGPLGPLRVSVESARVNDVIDGSATRNRRSRSMPSRHAILVDMAGPKLRLSPCIR